MQNTSFTVYKNRFERSEKLSGRDLFEIIKDLEDINDEVNTHTTQIAAIIAGDIYDEVTTTELLDKINTFTLVPAKAYKLTNLAEPLIVYATATNKIGFWAYSPSYPQ